MALLYALCAYCFYLYTYVALSFFFFFFNDTATTEIYTLSLHDALPICPGRISEKAHAASMTPAPKPNRVSCVRSDRRWDSITGTVPSAVASAAAEPPARAWKTTGWFWA